MGLLSGCINDGAGFIQETRGSGPGHPGYPHANFDLHFEFIDIVGMLRKKLNISTFERKSNSFPCL